MGVVLGHIPVKLVVGLISGMPSRFDVTGRILKKKFGKIDNESSIFDFSSTSYYDGEFGKNLKRKFLSFGRLIRLRKNYRLKLYTNAVERKLSVNKGGELLRTVNIDPGYISLTKLVLFTTKNRSHRIYIDKGIYADLELQFSDKSFQPISWTYPDYRTAEYINFFNSVRAAYVKQVKRYIKVK